MSSMNSRVANPLYTAGTKEMLNNVREQLYGLADLTRVLNSEARRVSEIEGFVAEPKDLMWALNTTLMVDGQIASFALVLRDEKWLVCMLKRRVGFRQPAILAKDIGMLDTRELFLVDMLQRLVPGQIGATLHAEMCVYRTLIKQLH